MEHDTKQDNTNNAPYNTNKAQYNIKTHPGGPALRSKAPATPPGPNGPAPSRALGLRPGPTGGPTYSTCVLYVVRKALMFPQKNPVFHMRELFSNNT